MHLGPAPWALDPAPTEPPHRTLVKDKKRTRQKAHKAGTRFLLSSRFCFSFWLNRPNGAMRRAFWLTGSSNSSKYFASNDSSDTSRKARKSQEASPEHQRDFETQVENSLWSIIQRTPERVMMTYQMHAR